MKYLITGTGQIGTQLAHDLTEAGDEVVVVRRSAGAVPEGCAVVRGDVADPTVLARASRGVDAIFHTIHAPYDARAWAAELPSREGAVMDAAAAAGIPVVFPESVYAFGDQALYIAEGAAPQPTTPLGVVRAELLAARAAHRATTISVVAADLFGPSAGAGSVATATVIKPVLAGHRAWVLADPTQPHSWTYIPDLTRAMAHCAHQAPDLAPGGDAVVLCPSPAPRTIHQLADDTSRLAAVRPARVRAIPQLALHLARGLHPMLRELANQQYLWRRPALLGPARALGALPPTSWTTALEATVQALRP